MTSCTGSVCWGFWDLRKVRVEFLPRKKKVDFRSSLRPCGGCRTWWGWGADGKVVIERLCLSPPYVEKTFNSKVIKSFVPELRSRKCFSCFGIPMLYMCVMNVMNILCTGMGISISHIHIWLFNTMIACKLCR